MLSLADLAALHATYAEEAGLPVAPARIGDLVVGDDAPVIMGTLNLSRDSTYRESVAVSTRRAIRKARVQIAQGATSSTSARSRAPRGPRGSARTSRSPGWCRS